MTARSAPAARVPFSVIGGFLGAGKTTLLNHWLRHAQGQRLALLVNDFGLINIDAGLIEAHAGDTIALTNGCVCCQIGDDLSLALLRILDSERRFDAVIVEASGVADPGRIAQLGRADPRLRLDAVIVLVDTSAVLAQSRDPLLADTLQRQVRAADLLLLNKVDLAGTAERQSVHEWIASLAGATPRVEATLAQLPMALLGAAYLRTDQPRIGLSPAEHGHPHSSIEPSHGDVFETWSCQPTRVFSATELRAWLHAPPPDLLRLKGFLRVQGADGSPIWSYLQFAGRHGTLSPAAPGAPDSAALVAIGLRGRLPRATLAFFFLETRAS